ncbi:MAG: hypothetical protein R3C11_16470 [Planctomycetaceae bacterium]
MSFTGREIIRAVEGCVVVSSLHPWRYGLFVVPPAEQVQIALLLLRGRLLCCLFAELGDEREDPGISRPSAS